MTHWEVTWTTCVDPPAVCLVPDAFGLASFPLSVGLWSWWILITIAAIIVISSSAPKSLLTDSVRKIQVLRKEAQINLFLLCLSVSFKCLINGLDYPLQANTWSRGRSCELLESAGCLQVLLCKFSSLFQWQKIFWDMKPPNLCLRSPSVGSSSLLPMKRWPL